MQKSATIKKTAVEFIGTFFLVFTVLASSGQLAPFAVAGVLTAMIFAGGHISGAHYNPAVTVSMFLRGTFPASEIVPYAVSQIAAAVCAGLLAGFFTPAPAAAPGYALAPLVIAEIVFTFALCFVVLNVATAGGTKGNSFYGLAIGLVVLCGAITVGPVSGAVFNPAVAVGLMVGGLASAADTLIYAAATIAAGAAATGAFLFVNGRE